MNLADVQRTFSSWLRTGSADDAASFGQRAQPGLNIYQNNFRAQLVACLKDSFAQTHQWIGGEGFHDAVVQHVDRVPPSSWTLDAYPRDFPATLGLLYPDDAEVAELAELELALAEAFVGSDAQPLSAEHIAQIDWDSAVLRFTPTLDLLPSTTNAPDIFSALARNDMPPAAIILLEPAALLIWRYAETSQFRVVDAAEQWAILLMRNGLRFADLCARLVADIGDEQGIALGGEWLGRWLAEGLIIDID